MILKLSDFLTMFFKNRRDKSTIPHKEGWSNEVTPTGPCGLQSYSLLINILPTPLAAIQCSVNLSDGNHVSVGSHTGDARGRHLLAAVLTGVSFSNDHVVARGNWFYYMKLT